MTTSRLRRHLFRSGVLAAALALTAAVQASDVPRDLDFNDATAKESWISLSAGVIDLSDDSAAGSYQRQRQHEDAGFGGIDSLRYRRSLENDRVLTIDGHALLGDNEFKLDIRLSDEAQGWFLNAGFKESRVFYNGVGGFFPNNAAWLRVYDDEVAIDRGEFWLGGGWTRDAWTVRVRASHRYREGIKDSTEWGDTGLTGLPGAQRNIVSTWLGIDETRDAITIDVEYQKEATKGGAGIRWENMEQENSRNVRRQPAAPNPTGAGERYITTWDNSDADLFAGHAFVERTYGEKLMLSAAGSFTNLDTNLSGSRIFGAGYDSDYDAAFPRGATDHGYIDMAGETQWDQWVLVGNALYMPAKGWRVQGGLRFENQSQDGISEYLETAGPVANPLEEPFEQENDREFDEVLASLEASYTGLQNWVFSAGAEIAAGEGDLFEEQLEGHDAPVVVVDRETEFQRDFQKYSATARWYPSKLANFAAGYYHKVRDNDYDTIADNTPPAGGNRYPAFITEQSFTTDDAYVRGTLRPGGGFSLTVRYDEQQTEIDSREENLPGQVRSELDASIISATASWTPHARVVVQAGVNLVDDDVVTGTVTANAPIAPSVGRFSSDYTTWNGLVMVVVDDRSDVQVDYYRFRADNYENVAAFTQPYGLTATDEILGVTYTRRLTEDLRWSLRYVYGQYDELTSGGNNDFESHMLYSRVQMRF